MKSNKLAPKKNTAQAMVEFAIVLPILLVLLYGVLEAGRLLFMYSSIVTASRQAVRYGATTGGGGNYTTESGPDNSTYKRYQDCYGIRREANRVDYLNAFDHLTDDIVISWDTGPGTTATVICPQGTNAQSWDPPTDPANANKSRIIVTIKGDFNPIVRLVPFMARTVANGNPIEAESRRTILTGVSITVAGGTGPADTKTELKLAPHEDTEPNSKWGELITATITVSNLSGTALPTGTIDLSITIAGVTGSVPSCQDVNVINGVATCYFTFPSMGEYSVTASYTPNDTNKFNESSGTVPKHVVGKASTTTTVIDTDDPSLINTPVNIHVAVTSPPGTSIPGGTVSVTTTAGNCTINLDSTGEGNCSVTYTSLGITNITAKYNGDGRHFESESMTSHEVLQDPPTPKPPTAIPPTAVVTAAPTSVPNCQAIREAVYAIDEPIQFLVDTMFVEIPNVNDYAVSIESIAVDWNQATGHIGTDSTLKLMSVAIDSTTIWQSPAGMYEPNLYTIPSFSNPAVLPKNQTSQLIFTFNQSYGIYEGEAIQVTFSTPGCEPYPILLPVGAPATSLKVQLRSNGSDNNQQSAFAYQIQNTGVTPATNISVRIYFTVDSPAKAADYVLEKYHDQSGAATISGPTQYASKVYYFTVSYGTATLAPGGVWEFQTSLHSDWSKSNFVGSNDWWHGSGSLPGSYTDWPLIPAYVDSTLVWGSPP